jgi:glutamyl-tRNA reductase
MNLVCVGISHHTALLDVREKLWFSPDEIRHTLPLIKSIGADEAVMFSTCNRTELYVFCENGIPKPNDLKTFLIAQKSAANTVQQSDLFILTAGDAARHLFRVTAGIDSMVLGDVQILAQAKEGFNLANELSTAGIFMNRLFQLALRVGKRARTETRVSEGAVSISYAAVELAEKIFEDLQEKTAFVIGAGETAELTAKHLRGKNIGKLLITNRTQGHADVLAQKVRGIVIPFDKWCDGLAESDIVISSVDTDTYIIRSDDIKRAVHTRKNGALLMIDLGVPRNIDPKVKDYENIFLYDLDSLNKMIKDNLQNRTTEIPKIEAIINDVFNELTKWYSSLEVNPTISALTQFMESIRMEELGKHINRFDPKDRELADLVTKRIINKIIHAPISYLHPEQDSPLADRMQKVNALQKLFGLAKTPKEGPDGE